MTDKHNTTETANIRNRAHVKPPKRKHIVAIHAPFQSQPRRCAACGGTHEVKDVTNCKMLCVKCDPARNGTSNGTS